ncbi:hypothetical protein IX84_26465 [Phaeodactylibacter xiamenensis]|uniref:Uncharacterized protein n=1 Tax=Phaeodactylibacter xiamenensis TaxID=1524460 RepID=A0A098RZP9_9BACT|nr:hypothetical protein IX84_26465 [Phaeodactylibacter xiamenensis]
MVVHFIVLQGRICAKLTQVFFSLARRKTQASVRTARLFNAASGKKSKSKCINLALENYIKHKLRRPFFVGPFLMVCDGLRFRAENKQYSGA